MPGGPGRRWGYHRLADPWARRLVVDAHIGRGDLVLDIGAGVGALTGPLVATGANVLAVELHPTRAARLRERFAEARVVVIQVDASDLRLPRRPFHVVANPPFALTMAVVRRLLAHGSRLVAADLVVPRYIARRWAGPHAPGRTRWSRSFDVSVGRTLPPHAFEPRATADALVLRIRRRDGASGRGDGCGRARPRSRRRPR